MGREAGHTQGFGRVSPVNRPSPYSPMHFRASLNAAADSASAANPRETPRALRQRRRVVRRAVLVVAILLAIGAGLGYVSLIRSPAAPSRAVIAPSAPAAPVTLDDEARRLSRSAIAASRR